MQTIDGCNTYELRRLICKLEGMARMHAQWIYHNSMLTGRDFVHGSQCPACKVGGPEFAKAAEMELCNLQNACGLYGCPATKCKARSNA